MKWAIPPKIKIYEALGCLGDERIREENSKIHVYSSSGNKFYVVKYSENENAIVTNDNGSFWKGYLGYPAIAYLMKIGKITFDRKFASALRGIKWKDINQKFKNDFVKTEKLIRKDLVLKEINLREIDMEIENILEQIRKLDLNLLGEKIRPPGGY